ncbi:hypothetical protein FGU71_06580 [Erythrobacter insulae]|uniref:Acid phosphatase n=1 Tax=Erythrobacter insulae TaxID=2584124 RepID=A0A547PBP7_9SPHN|nr:hypothetical protein [Erythrobacter insulae]TRD11557.1 hypothetical protein FGU71_06580 [Erythrobacter insulae]
MIVLIVAGLSLSGCVAAVIPIVAGGALARSETRGNVMVEAEQQSLPGLPDNKAALANGEPSLDGPQRAAPFAVQPAATEFADRSRQSPRLDEFIRYSTQQAYLFSENEQPLPSAVLSDSASLDGRRIDCKPASDRNPAVLIDLDPGQETFTARSALPTSTSIALSLKVLRSEGVEIAWISANSAADADVVRAALTRSGLDPDAQDTLLLMRYPGDRKQTRRKEFASETCLIAIAGDNRRDFDELYDYLSNREAAFRLEKLINNGWFLIGSDTLDDAQETQSGQPVNDATDTAPAEMPGSPNAMQTPDGKPK